MTEQRIEILEQEVKNLKEELAACHEKFEILFDGWEEMLDDMEKAQREQIDKEMQTFKKIIALQLDAPKQ